MLHGAGRPRRAAASTRTCPAAASPAASAPAWRATRCTASGSTTSRRDRLWVNLYAPSTARVGRRGRDAGDGDELSRRRVGDVEADDCERRRRSRWRCGVRRGPATGFARQGQRRARSSDLRRARLLHRADADVEERRHGRRWRCPRRCTSSRWPTIRAARRSCGVRWCSPAISGREPRAPRRGRRRRRSLPDIAGAGRRRAASSADWLKPVAGKPGEFRTEGVGQDQTWNWCRSTACTGALYTAYCDLSRRRELGSRNRQRSRPSASSAASWNGDGRLRAAGRDAAGARLQPAGRGHVDRRASTAAPADAAEVVLLRHAAWTRRTTNVLVVTYHSDNRRPRIFDILVDGQPPRRGAHRVRQRIALLRSRIRAARGPGPRQDAGDDPVPGHRRNEIAAVFGLPRRETVSRGTTPNPTTPQRHNELPTSNAQNSQVGAL